MARGLFHLSIITPERAVLALDGEVGILHGRASLLYKLGTGKLRAETPEGEQVFYVDGGLEDMAEDRLAILTQQAKRPQEIDRAAGARRGARHQRQTKKRSRHASKPSRGLGRRSRLDPGYDLASILATRNSKRCERYVSGIGHMA